MCVCMCEHVSTLTVACNMVYRAVNMSVTSLAVRIVI